jgi:hypothetical protein
MSSLIAGMFAIIRLRSPTVKAMESAGLICKFYVPHTSFRIDDLGSALISNHDLSNTNSF